MPIIRHWHASGLRWRHAGATDAAGELQPRRDLEAHERLHEIGACLLVIDGLFVSKLRFRALARLLCARDVDVTGVLGDARKERDAIRQHFGEPEGEREVRLLLSLAVPHLAYRERCQHWRVPWQDAEIPFGPRHLHFVHLLADEQAVGRDDLQLERRRDRRCGHQLFAIFSAFSSASSMVPTRKNACSGTASCLPSTISLKLLTVSAIGTYLPGIPVNCSATKNGCDRNFWILRARATVSLSSSESSSMPRIAMMSCKSL